MNLAGKQNMKQQTVGEDKNLTAVIIFFTRTECPGGGGSVSIVNIIYSAQ